MALARRGNGEGTINQRTDGRWQGSLQLGGKRQTVYGHAQKEVREKLAALQQQAPTTGKLPDGRHTLGELLALWLDTGGHRWAPFTLQNYRRQARIILADLGDRITLRKLTPARLQAVVNAHTGTPRSAQLLYDALRAALTLAVKWDWLASNPMTRVERPGHRPPRRQWWTPDQCRAFLQETAASRWGPLWALAITTGARLGELSALQWTDLDGERRTITIERTGQHAGGQWVVKEPKTAAGRRTIPLNGLALAALHRQRAQQAAWRLKAGEAWQDTGLVFTSLEGRPLRRYDVAKALRTTVKRLGLPAATMHTFRHLSGSLALEAGAPLTLVSKHLGHSSVSITAHIYSHALSNGTAVTDAVERLLASTPTQGERTTHAP
ncbi:MAG: site-specific integrase [Chloroflexi bacterium]|nr:site-specific integrase [Chloroflexota bacterium]